MKEIARMENLSLHVRRIILEQSQRANVGHIGSALSIADIISALYMNVLKINDFRNQDRDRFILSKGHAALALYAVLYLKGCISEAELNTYCGDASLLGVHPDHNLAGIDFSTGSLGMGLSMGVGAALAARMQNSARRVYVLLSDAECNEGSTWEAVMVAAHHRLDNLVAIVDLNGQQALGYTDDVLSLKPMIDKWQIFNWDAHDVDGHDINSITRKIDGLRKIKGKPHVVIAHTISGKGVSFMENQIKWHYWPLSNDEYHLAMKEIEIS
jgi:transketolase